MEEYFYFDYLCHEKLLTTDQVFGFKPVFYPAAEPHRSEEDMSAFNRHR